MAKKEAKPNVEGIGARLFKTKNGEYVGVFSFEMTDDSKCPKIVLTEKNIEDMKMMLDGILENFRLNRMDEGYIIVDR